MNTVTVNFVIGLLVCIVTDTLCEDFKPASLNHRIVGGIPAMPNEIPYQVSLRLKKTGEHFCGGTLVTDRHVLTSASCTINKSALKTSELFIEVGSINLASGHYRDIATIQRYPGYNTKFLKDDIAVLRLDYPLEMTESVLNIVKQASVVQEGDNCTVSGFGALGEAEVASLTLMVGKLPIYNYNKCKQAYMQNGESAVGNKMICAGFANGSVDACQGDSGGPLVCGKAVTGIATFRTNCNRRDIPGVYTEVSKYRDWIQIAINGAITTSTLSTCLLIVVQFVLNFLH